MVPHVGGVAWVDSDERLFLLRRCEASGGCVAGRRGGTVATRGAWRRVPRLSLA